MDKMHVLIIDDSRQLAQAYQRILLNIGFECELAHSAKDAFARLASQVPNLILLDLRLGHEIGGEDILHQVRSNPRFDGTRVIVITAYPEVAKLVNTLADLVLLKPVDIDQLITFSERIGSIDFKPKPFPFRDPITQLFNKEFFHTQLEYAFARGKRRNEFLFAVILLQINLQGIPESQILPDTWASLIQEIAGRLRRQTRTTDTVARFNAWEFAILAEELKHPDDLEVIIKRISSSITEPIQVEGTLYRFTVDFGAAIYIPNYKNPEEIIEAASQALKRTG
jgi:diguanylate cyclase (GGDEF)-like protein